jgi:hypothetical protein
MHCLLSPIGEAICMRFIITEKLKQNIKKPLITERLFYLTITKTNTMYTETNTETKLLKKHFLL